MREPRWNRTASSGGSHDAATIEVAVVANGSPSIMVTTTDTPVTIWPATPRKATRPSGFARMVAFMRLPDSVGGNAERQPAGVGEGPLRIEGVECPGPNVTIGLLQGG